MRAAIAVMTLAACGRIGFPAHGDALTGDAHGDAHGDAMPDTSDAAVPACVTFDVTSAVPMFAISGLTWIGDRYVVLNGSGLATIDSHGNLSAFQQLSPAVATVYEGQQGVAWNGTQLLATWVSANGAIQFQPFDGNLVATHAAVELVATSGQQPYVIWTGSTFAATWAEVAATPTLHVAELASDGVTVAYMYTPSGTTLQNVTSMIATPTHYVVAVETSAGPYAIAAPAPLTNTFTQSALAVPGTGYLQLASLSSGGGVAVGTSTTAALQQFGPDGGAGGSTLILPNDGATGGSPSNATVARFGALERIVLSSTQDRDYTADYDPVGGTFSVVDRGAFTANSVAPPAVAIGPGRTLIEQPFATTTAGLTDYLRMIELCP